MKLTYKSNRKEKKKAITIERITERHLEQNWHYHDEFELIYYIKGNGTRVVGDNLSDFISKDLVLVGSGLPHLWKNSEDVDQHGLDVIIMKFDIQDSCFMLLNLPEFVMVKELFKFAQRGVKLNATNEIEQLILSIDSAEPAMQIILFLKLLNILASCNDMELLASPEFSLHMTNSEEQRLNRIIEFVSSNYTNPLTLDNISKEAAMTPNSLCRFFKSRTNKTIFQFLNEFRVGKACELLINGDKSISVICFETGFTSITSFNRVFKELKSVTPRDFKRKYQALNSRINMHAYSA